MAARKSTKSTEPVAITADTSKLSGGQAKSLARLSDAFKTALNEGKLSPWVGYKTSILGAEKQAALFDATVAKGVKPTTGLIDAVNRSVARLGLSFEEALARVAADPKALRAETENVRVRSEGIVRRPKAAPAPAEADASAA